MKRGQNNGWQEDTRQEKRWDVVRRAHEINQRVGQRSGAGAGNRHLDLVRVGDVVLDCKLQVVRRVWPDDPVGAQIVEGGRLVLRDVGYPGVLVLQVGYDGHRRGASTDIDEVASQIHAHQRAQLVQATDVGQTVRAQVKRVKIGQAQQGGDIGDAVVIKTQGLEVRQCRS